MKSSSRLHPPHRARRRQTPSYQQRFTFAELPRDLKKTAYLLAEGWTDWEIASFLDLELGDIQRSRQRLALHLS